MQLKVEFLGLARELAGTKEALVELAPQATWRQVLKSLAAQHPALVGPVIIPDHLELAPSFMFNVGGRAVVRDLDRPAEAGERVLLMFAEAGG